MNLPQVSVIVPTFNRLDYLQKCLASLVQLNHPAFEIIVVNDGSTDETPTYLQELSKQINNLRLINQPNNGPSAARNAGIAAAGADIIAFTDDDCQPEPNWLVEVTKPFEDPNIVGVIGRTVYVSKNHRGRFPERVVQNPEAAFPMSCNLGYRKSALQKINGFDSFFDQFTNEDAELALRILKANLGRLAPNKKALVYHQPAFWNSKSLLKSAKNHAAWVYFTRDYKPQLTQLNATNSFGPILFPKDYLQIIFLPILLPLLLIRYLLRGHANLKLFFLKWPIIIFLKRYHIWKTALGQLYVQA